MKIYNRWGEEVFNSDKRVSYEWNGDELPKAVFTYIISYTLNREKKVMNGNLTLVR
jgi:hypothetical protein